MQKKEYDWTLKGAKFKEDRGNVFSCFSAGGGSSMGYKLSGFKVLGCNEIDKKMMGIYRCNFKPKYSYLEDIVEFVKRETYPEELYSLDILDGSPPCSSFSMVGAREKDWGKEKKFKEGQKKQVLDTLFFDFITLAKKLKPKVVVAENVKGLLMGEAKEYVRRIYKEFDKAGYYCQHFLLDSSTMGVLQTRERVFFICLRKDLAPNFLYKKDLFSIVPKIDFNFNFDKIAFKNVFIPGSGPAVKGAIKEVLDFAKRGETDLRYSFERLKGRKSLYGYKLLYLENVAPTITASGLNTIVFDEKRYLGESEMMKIGAWPKDYNFNNIKVEYVLGMSVPPLMMKRIADEIYKQWLSKL